MGSLLKKGLAGVDAVRACSGPAYERVSWNQDASLGSDADVQPSFKLENGMKDETFLRKVGQ
jgi:hypothetical protein